MVKQDEQTASDTGQTQTMQGGGAITGGTEVEIKAKETEKQDLAALESLLAKAQKTSDIQTKIDEATSKADQKKKISKQPLPLPTKPPQKQPMQRTAKQILFKASKPQAKQSVPIRKPATQKPAIKSTYSASYGRPSSAKSLMRPTSSRGSAKMYLDSVLSKDKKNGTASKGMSRKQGDISSGIEAGPSDKATQRLTTAENLNLEQKDSNTRTHSELQPHHDLQIALLSEKDSRVSEKTDNVNEYSEESQEGTLEGDNMKQLALNDGFGKSVTGRPGQSSVLGGLDHQSKSEKQVFPEGKEDWLDPFAEGAEFTLPTKYRKLKSTSTRLYSELRKIVEKDDKPWPCEQFVERLEAGFAAGNVSTQKETQDKVNRLLEDHEKLSMLTSAVVTRSYNLKDDSSWQEVYKCYRHWQIVLSKFNELQRRTQQLLQAEEQHSTGCCGSCSLFDRDHPRETSSAQQKQNNGCVLLSRWLPDEIDGHSGGELFQEFNKQHGTVDFTYSSAKELHELVRLHHEVQLLSLQLHVKQLAGEKLLPLLEKIDPFGSAFVPLYRVTHGLLWRWRWRWQGFSSHGP